MWQRFTDLLALFIVTIGTNADLSLSTAQILLQESANHAGPSGHYSFQHKHFFHHPAVALNPPTVGDAHNSGIQFKSVQDFHFLSNAPENPPLSNLSVAIVLDHDKLRRNEIVSNGINGVGLNDSAMAPNVSDKLTVVNLAKMTSDAYVYDPSGPDWLNTSLGFNFTERFGWKGDGLRGHVFGTEDNSTIVIAFKGTSLDPRSRFRNKDLLNDNRLFSCCCGAQNPYFYPAVCSCKIDTFACNSTCLTESVLDKDMYYTAALNVTYAVMAMYPDSAFWVIGHSLGGALASFVAMTLDIPGVSYESPPDRLAAERLGLVDTDHRTVHHFGNTGDPIYMGMCNGFFSLCSLWGFNFESQCFTGTQHIYDTVKDKGWRSSLSNHRINLVISEVLEKYDEVPEGVNRTDCTDCARWRFT